MSFLRNTNLSPLRPHYVSFGLIACLLLIQATNALRAQDRTDPPVISYDPSLVQIEGPLPKAYTYTVGIKSPSNLPTSASTPITFALTPTKKPASVSDLTARGYVTFSPATLSFSGPDQVQNVSITLSIPVNGEPGDYNYKILSEGWPVDPEFGLTNNGTFINATVTAAAVGWTPPTVAISSPGNNSTVLVQAGSLPAIVPISFTVTSSGPYPSPIDSAPYELDGDPQPISLSSFSGIGSYSVSGSGTMTVATVGPHTVTVRGHNLGGTVTGASTFTVVIVGPPTVQIVSPSANAVVAYDASGPRPAIPFSFSANSPSGSLIAYTAQLNGGNIPLSSIAGGVGTLAMTGAAADLAGAVAGSNSLVVTATNAYGTATATSTFRVNPVSIAINTPADGSTIVLPAGSLTSNIGFKFTTTAGSGFTVDSVGAKLDGSIANVVISSPGTGSSTAETTGTLLGVGEGSHTLLVSAVSSGVAVKTSVSFNVVVMRPAPTIAIDYPVAGAEFTADVSGTADVGFSFTTSTSTGFVVDAVAYKIDGGAWVSMTAPGLGSAATVTAVGDLQDLAIGTHTLTVRGSSFGVAVETSTNFVVKPAPVVTTPPTVSILAPTLPSYALPSSGPLALTLTFKGSSTFATGTITQLTATISSSLGTTTLTVPAFTPAHDVQVSIPFSVSSALVYTLNVTAKDEGGTASDSKSFTVTAPSVVTISGTVFLDANFNGIRNTDEPGLGGVPVSLLSSAGAVLSTASSGADGSYSFTVNAGSGSYGLKVSPPTGLSPTSVNNNQTLVVASASVTAADAGFGLNWAQIRTLSSTALSQGFWKNNVNKAIAGTTKGVQVDRATMLNYTSAVGGLALAPFAGLDLNKASAIFSGKSQLDLQLLASEYNYASKAYIGGSETLTYAFIYWGEFVLKNAKTTANPTGAYDSAYQTFAAKWFEAYNTSEGGKVLGPLP